MKRFITTLTIVTTLGASIFSTLAFAENSENGRGQIKDARKEMHQNIKNERKEFRQEVKDVRNDLKDKRASEAAKRKLNKVGHLINAEITAINGSSLTVVKDGKTYIVNTSSQTKFLRHFWGKSETNEFSVGNKVNVWGKWADEGQTTIDARMIRNLSIMKRHGVFMGEIISATAGSFVLKSLNRGDQTVLYGSTTKFVNRKEQTIAASELKVGDKVRVKGLWDKSNNKITEVSQVKDFSLPERVKVSVTPTVAVTATPTP